VKCRELAILSVSCAFITVGAYSQKQPAKPWVDAYEASPATYNIVMPKNLPQNLGQYAKGSLFSGTLRYRFGISLGGNQLEVCLSNELGDKPLEIGGASIAIAGSEMDAAPGSIRRLTFGGKPGVVVPAGAPVYSDPTDLRVQSASDLIVSVSIKSPVALSPFGGATMMLVDGDAVLEEKLSNPRKVVGRPIATSVLVVPERPADVVVALGDSISDGVRAKPSEPHGWVSYIAERLAADKKYKSTGIVTAGIGGNRVIRSGWGPSALARADRDVFSLPGVHSVILLEGINDIGFSDTSVPGDPELKIDANELIAGYQQLAISAHAHGLKILIGTLTPFEGSFYFDAEKEELWQTVNAWIRSNKEFDGVIDFDKALRDPAQPKRMNPAFDSGDHLHPNEIGYKAMADAVDLSNIR